MRGAAAAPGTPGVCGRVPGTAGCPPPPGLRDGAESRGRMRFSFFFFFSGFSLVFAELSEGQREPRRSSARSKGQPRPVLGVVFCPLGPLGGGGQSSPGRPGAEGGALPAPRLPAHTQAADGGGGWLCQTHTHTHTPETPIILSLTRCFCCPRLLTLQHSCQQASLRAQNPHAAPLPAPQPRTRQIEPCRCLGGGSGGDGGLGTARLSPARLGPARPGASRRGQARRRALGSDQAKGSCVALFPALRSPNV